MNNSQRRRRAPVPPPQNRIAVREVFIGVFACLGLFLSGVLVGRMSDPFRFDAPEAPKAVIAVESEVEPEGDR